MKRERVGRWLARRLILLTALIVATSAFAALAPLHWFLELFSHYALHYAMLGFLLAVTLFAVNRRRWAGVALLAAAWNAFVVAQPVSQPSRQIAGAGGEQVTIFHFNVGFRHYDPRRVVDHVLANAKRLDIVVLIETSDGWNDELQRLAPVYPYSVKRLEDSPFGIVALSKTEPLTAAIVDAPNGYRHSEMRFTLAGHKRALTVYGIHPPPPLSAEMADARNDKLEWLAQTIRSRGEERAVVVGDFNLTPYSPHFPAFARRSGLQPALSGLFPQGTWPVLFGTAAFGIPIDHAFVPAEAAVVAREIGPDLGSDHLPVTLTLAFNEAPTAVAGERLRR